MLAVGDEFVFGETLDGEAVVLDAAVPGQEMPQIVPVAAQGRRREVVTRQAVEERRHPAGLGSDCPGCLYCTQCHPPC